MDLDATVCYRAVRSRDRRFDGVFYTAVHSTGIYCRPSCPARTPRPENVSFHPTAAAAHAAGFRACRRCLPDATPGSPRWDLAADLAGRAMRLVADGVVEREGVEGLARRLGYSSRHLNRLLRAELGAGPLALARAHRAQTARVLIDTTDLDFATVAFAAGFASVRQFNDTIREVYAATPTQLRRGRRRPTAPGTIDLRLGVREPFDAPALFGFLVRHRVPGVETGDAGRFVRSVRLPHGVGTMALEPSDPGHVRVRLRLSDLRDTAAAVERARRLIDADADPVAVAEHLSRDRALRPLLRRHPGLRIPGHVDGFEGLVRTVLGQQVSVASGNAAAARLTRELGSRLAPSDPEGGGEPDAASDEVTHVFPDPAQLAAADPTTWALPSRRATTLHRLATEVAEGRLELDRGVDRAAVRAQLLALPGVGPWTADVVAMRVWGDPDVWLSTDLVTRRASAQLGLAPEAAAGWSPWRSYAQIQVWQLVLGSPHRNRKESS